VAAVFDNNIAATKAIKRGAPGTHSNTGGREDGTDECDLLSIPNSLDMGLIGGESWDAVFGGCKASLPFGLFLSESTSLQPSLSPMLFHDGIDTKVPLLGAQPPDLPHSYQYHLPPPNSTHHSMSPSNSRHTDLLFVFQFTNYNLPDKKSAVYDVDWYGSSSKILFMVLVDRHEKSIKKMTEIRP
jgi:hypothetical protein